MQYVLTSSIMLMALVMLAAIGQGQSRGVDSNRHINSSDLSGKMREPNSLGPASSPGGTKFQPPASHVPSRSPDLGSPTSPLSPSIGPGSGLLGPESGSGPT